MMDRDNIIDFYERYPHIARAKSLRESKARFEATVRRLIAQGIIHIVS